MFVVLGYVEVGCFCDEFFHPVAQCRRCCWLRVRSVRLRTVKRCVQASRRAGEPGGQASRSAGEQASRRAGATRRRCHVLMLASCRRFAAADCALSVTESCVWGRRGGGRPRAVEVLVSDGRMAAVAWPDEGSAGECARRIVRLDGRDVFVSAFLRLGRRWFLRVRMAVIGGHRR